MQTDQLAGIPQAMIITAKEHLEEVVAGFKGIKRLAIDTESNGFYVYKERVCLIQLSTPTADYIIDPIAITDLSSLAPLIADPGIEKLFHAGEYDVVCLKRDYGWEFNNLFDTMIAGRLLGVKELGLAAAILRHFDIKLNKKFQRADWGRRPLTSPQLRYAQMDTHFLMRLADIQKAQLKEKGRLDNAGEAFKELCKLKPMVKAFDPGGFWKLAGGKNFNSRQLAVLKELYLFREHESERRNRAPFRVMPEDILIKLTNHMPDTYEGLKAAGMTPYLLSHYSKGMLAALKKAKAGNPIPPDSRPRNRRDPREFKLFETLRMWRKKKAEGMDVDPVAIVSSEELHTVACRVAQNASNPLEELSDFKRERYGADLLKALGR